MAYGVSWQDHTLHPTSTTPPAAHPSFEAEFDGAWRAAVCRTSVLTAGTRNRGPSSEISARTEEQKLEFQVVGASGRTYLPPRFAPATESPAMVTPSWGFSRMQRTEGDVHEEIGGVPVPSGGVRRTRPQDVGRRGEGSAHEDGCGVGKAGRVL